MRVLVMRENGNGYNSVVTEVEDIGYSDCILKTYEDENHIEFTSGLSILKCGVDIYFEGVSQAECDLLCEKMLLEGYLDLRKYGIYSVEDDVE